MIKWLRVEKGHYVSKHGRFQIKLEPGCNDAWTLTEYDPLMGGKKLPGCFVHYTLRGCKEEAQMRADNDNHRNNTFED